MSESEKFWWETIRRRRALWCVANKGLAFFVAYPVLGYFVIGWEWQATLLLEGWLIGLVCGGFVWMRKELRYRFALDQQGLALPDRTDE